LTEATADEFDLEVGLWSIPHARRKNRRFTVGPHEKPLPQEAIEWVRELKTMQDRKGYLFPQECRRHVDGRTERSKRTTIGGWLDRIHAESQSWRRVTPHDFRAMCKTYLTELRIDYEIRQEYLDHAKATVVDRIYDKADLLEGKADAAKRLMAYLKRLESDVPSQKVVPIR
jgi:integrase